MAVLGASIFYWLQYEQNYRASCWFRINVERDFIVFRSFAASEKFVSTQIELVRSPLVISPVVSVPSIANYLLKREIDSPLDWLSKNIEVNIVGQSEFLEIAFACENARTAQEVVEAVAGSYLNIYVQDTDQQRQQVIQLLEDEKNLTANQVQKQRDAVRMQSKLALGTDPYRVGDSNQALLDSSRTAILLEMERSLMKTEMDLNYARSDLRDFFTQHVPHPLTRIIPEAEIEQQVGESETLQSLQTELHEKRQQQAQREPGNRPEKALVDRQIAELEAKIEQTNSKLVEHLREDLRVSDWREQLVAQIDQLDPNWIEQRMELDPTVRQMEANIEAMQGHMEHLAKPFRSGRRPAKYDLLEKNLTEEQVELASYKEQVRLVLESESQQQFSPLTNTVLARFTEKVAQINRLRAYCDLYADRVAELDVNFGDEEARQFITLDLEFAQRELERIEAVHQRISDRLLELRTEERAPRRVSRKTEQALVANVDSLGSFYKKIGLVMLLGFCLPFGLGLMWDMTHVRVSDVDSIQSHWNLRILGEVAQLPAQPSLLSPISQAKILQQNEVFQESILNLTAQVSLCDALADAKVIALTSAVGGESKSTVSTYLAASLARTHNQPILIIDGDLRSPSVAGMLHAKPSPGLADVLQRTSSLSDAIQASSIPNLYVLTAGEHTSNPHHLFHQERLAALFAKLRAKFEFIVVDTPPVLSAGETLSLAKVADATLLCTLRDVSMVSQIDLSLEKLASVGGPVVGAILSGVPDRQYRQTYGAPSGTATRESARTTIPV
jgi:capsular exopolysaccharide synthesis family protein